MELELEPVLVLDVEDVDEAAGAAAGVDGFEEAGVLLDEAPRLSFR